VYEEMEDRCLWKWSGSKPIHGCPITSNSENYQDLLRKYTSRAKHVPLARLCANALPVVQEFTLIVYVLLVHRVAARYASRDDDDAATRVPTWGGTLVHDFFANDLVLTNATILVYACLTVPTILTVSPLFGAKRQSARFITDWIVRPFVTAAVFRVAAALAVRYLISALLNIDGGVTHETREYFECAGMLVHLLVKDYSAANGMGQTTDHCGRRDKVWPASLGDFMSIKNAGIFSSLLANSQVNSFIVGYMTMLIFLHYPAFQSDVSKAFPPHSSRTLLLQSQSFLEKRLTFPLLSVFQWIAAGGIICADCLLLWRLESSNSILPFLTAVGALNFAIPVWKYRLRKSKRLLRGSWDIPQRNSLDTGITRRT
jgi:hypothetical protein